MEGGAAEVGGVAEGGCFDFTLASMYALAASESCGVAEGGCSDRQPVNNTVNIPVRIPANMAVAKAVAPGSLIEPAHGGVNVLFRQAGSRRHRLR